MSEHRIQDLAELVGAEVRGDATKRVRGIRPLDVAGPADLSFLTSARYREQAAASRAGALLVSADVDELEGWSGASRPVLVAADAYAALARIMQYLHPLPEVEPGTHPTAVVDPRAEVAESATIGPFAVIGAASRIGARAQLGAHVVVGRGCSVGEDAVLHAHSVLYDRTEVGPRAVLHSGAILGADGFGFAGGDALPTKLPQVGRVVLEEDVEVGANSAVDRATFETTRLRRGVKLDNLVQVGHNVDLGEGSLLCGQSGISGSTRVGRNVIFAGQSGAAGHLEIGDEVRVAAQAAVLRSVPAGESVGGSPAVPLSQWRREVAARGRLVELGRRLRRLEQRLEELAESANEEAPDQGASR